MRNEPVTMNDFAESVREELQNDLGVLFPGIKVVVQQVDKIQGDSYLGIRIDRQDGMASPVLNLEPHFKDMKTFKPYEKVVSDILEKAETVLRDMPQITLDDLNDYSQLKDNLIMQVISVKGNEERLADMPHEQITKAFEKLIEDNDLPRVVFHSLRHSSISYKLKLTGGDIKAVQGDSGHAQVKMVTDVYSHVFEDDWVKNARLIEETFYSGRNGSTGEEPVAAKEPAPEQAEETDAEKMLKLLQKPEMAALVKTLASSL